MRVLAVFILMCLLFQTTILAQLASSETQHQIPSGPPEQNPHPDSVPTSDTNFNQQLDQKTVSDSEKTVSKFKENTESNLDEKTESNLNETTEKNLDEKTEKNLDEKTEKNLEEKTEINLDEKTEKNLEEKTEINLDEKTEKNLDEKTEIKSKEKNESKLEGKKESKTDSKTYDDFLDSDQCLQQKYTRLSCSKAFCPPWRRCIEGQCVCKMPYKCPRQDLHACTLEGSEYYSMCQIKAISCRSNTAAFSHFGTGCKVEDKVFAEVEDSLNLTMINTEKGKTFVCGSGWNMAAANVVCRNPLNFIRGALKATKVKYRKLKNKTDWPNSCMKVQCTGSELSLAECSIYNPETVADDTELATATCYDEPPGNCKSFLCANGKCLLSGRPCDGVDDCGDNSDEMCCRKCTRTAFHCKSGVCIPKHAVRDGIRDCLGGEDELSENLKPEEIDPQKLFSNPMLEIKTIRSSTESQLQCGIPNMEYEHKLEDDAASHSRRKRLVGGEEALPTQIQWQVAIQDEGSIHCGGAYLGGCWVLTAAHCVRPKPKSYRIKISLWKKHRKQSTTDSIPVKNIIIHHEYNPQTYANDIALVQLEELNLSHKCMQDNPAVRAVCVPWSSQQFLPNSTCTISGWGRDREGMSSSILKWANVTIIGDCKNYYKDRFLPGMECAGDLDGKVDSCQGDSGGPLVCKDASGVSYVWGIVSWGDKCGQPNNPGVYTKVAHYFDWIRFHTGWPAVTKYNQ